MTYSIGDDWLMDSQGLPRIHSHNQRHPTVMTLVLTVVAFVAHVAMRLCQFETRFPNGTLVSWVLYGVPE